METIYTTNKISSTKFIRKDFISEREKTVNDYMFRMFSILSLRRFIVTVAVIEYLLLYQIWEQYIITMSGKHSTVVNFILSKDFHELVNLRIDSLRGISTLQLYNKIYPQNNKQSTRTDYTDLLIENRIQDTISETEIFTEIHVESGIGKQLTTPIIIGLSGKLSGRRCKINHLNDGANNQLSFGDYEIINFYVFEGGISNNINVNSSVSISSLSVAGSLSLHKENKDSLNSWITLPIEYSKLPIDANIVFSNWCFNIETNEKILLNSGRIQMFDKNCTLLKGRINVKLQDDNTESIDNGKNKQKNPKDRKNEIKSVDEILTLISNDSERPEWLNRLTISKLDESENNGLFNINTTISQTEMIIEFRDYNVPVVFSDIKYVPIAIPKYDLTVSVSNYDPSFNEVKYLNFEGSIEDNISHLYSNTKCPFDPDQIRDELMEDPIEQKFRKLERMQHISPVDRDLKPTLRMRQSLNEILKKQFFEKMSSKERNVVWRYRWFILNTAIIGNIGISNSIINFIKCVDWNNVNEVKEFENILQTITNAISSSTHDNSSKTINSPFKLFIEQLQLVDCLELLSSNFRNATVRNMAIKRLHSASNAELSIFMVQLVQNIKNELYVEKKPNNPNQVSYRAENRPDVDEEEGDLQIRSKDISTSTHTMSSSEYHIVGNDDYENESGVDSEITDFMDILLFKNSKKNRMDVADIGSEFINFMIDRCIKDSSLTNYFYWCLKVEFEEEASRNRVSTGNETQIDFQKTINANDSSNRTASNNDSSDKINNMGFKGSTDKNNNIYAMTMKMFLIRLFKSEHGKEKLFELRRQIELVNKLHRFCYSIKVLHRKETTPMKLEILKNLLREKQKRSIFGTKFDSRNISFDDSKHEYLVEFPKIAIPLDPTVLVNGVFPDESAVFKSSLNPLKITFKTTQGEKYPIMYKIGDDLRQDQFVTQIITLMEKILESENMDLRLKPYKILATGKVEGFIQFIPNSSLSHILSKYNNSILLYLQTFNPDPDAHLGVSPKVMDNYVRSCAGYCVVTYILGVGDRHLENLLLSKDGHFFHADFGYILGQDPKPFPPLMKLPIQIIEGMGGSDDINYKAFCQYCFITYITLRKNSSLILNLVQLMINTSIPALRTSLENSEAEKMELLWKVKEKFMLDMTDEEAVLHFQNLIDSSVNAVLPVVIDRLHNLAQYWRS